MSSESKCPFFQAAPSGGGTTSDDWWSDRLKVELLHQHSVKSDPMEADFDYKKEFESLDLEAVKKDLTEVMTDSQDWWPADFGHTMVHSLCVWLGTVLVLTAPVTDVEVVAVVSNVLHH